MVLTKSTCISLVFCLAFLLVPSFIFAGGKPEEIPVEVKVVTDMQDAYEALDETVPSMVMLAATGTTIIPQEMLLAIDRELPRLLIQGGKIRPISMEKYLAKTYFEQKASNPFALMNALNSERYAVTVKYMCKPYVFKADDYYVLSLSFYSLTSGNMYPITVFRLFEDAGAIGDVLSASLSEMERRLFSTTNIEKKRVIVNDFSLSFLRLAELETGEFEFIPVPFIEKYGVALRDGDDYHSLLMGYILSTTNMFEVMRPSDFSLYANSSGITSRYADYAIDGNVQLSEQLNVLYVYVRDLRTNAEIYSIRYPLHDYTLKNIWEVYRDISVDIVEKIYSEGTFGIVETIEDQDRAFYANNMFIGWDSLTQQVLPKGMNEILVGSYYYMDSRNERYEYPVPEKKDDENIVSDSVDTYYVFIDTIDSVFTDREGEFFMNLLEKEVQK